MDPDDEFLISYVDDDGEQYFESGIAVDRVSDFIETAIEDCGAQKILIARQGDEDE